MDERKKQRRIRGEHFWAIRSLAQAVDDARREVQDTAEDQAKALKLYVDQVNWDTGLILDPPGNNHSPLHVPQEVLDRVRVKTRALRTAQEALREKLTLVAQLAGTWPDAINPATGEVSDQDFDIVETRTVKVDS